MSGMEIDNMDDAEPELSDASDPSVLEKYKKAGIIANRVLYTLIDHCKPGTKIVDLCILGDKMIEKECSNYYPDLNTKGQKGIAFPTCISINEICGHYSPLSDDLRCLHYGDMIKIDLGVHFDGWCAVVAHTIVLGVCDSRKADVIASAWTASQAALRLMSIDNKNTQITLAISKACETFKCEPLESVLSHEMRQYVIDAENTILSKETAERKVAEFDFAEYQVFGIDIIMSTGRGKPVDRGDKCTVYKRNVEIEFPLKMKTSRELITSINKKYPTFPFSMRNFEENRSRLGIHECKKVNLVQPYPVLSEKVGEFVAQFKYTVVLTKKGPIQICGLPLDMSTVHPNYQVSDNELSALLQTQLKGELPSFYEIPAMPTSQQLSQMEIEFEHKSNSGRNSGNKNKNSGNNNKNNNNNNRNNNKNKKNQNNKNKGNKGKQNKKGGNKQQNKQNKSKGNNNKQNNRQNNKSRQNQNQSNNNNNNSNNNNNNNSQSRPVMDLD